MLSLGPAARSRVGFARHSLALALASALLALSLGLLIATVTGPQGEGAQAIDGWHRLMSGDLHALLVFSLPCAAWLVAVAAYIRSSPARAATPVGPQVPAQDETATSPSTHLHDNMESEIPVQVRRSFRDALREDGVGLALSRPAGRQIGTAHAHKEEDEMLKRRMAVMALTAAGTISACDSMGPGPPLVSKAVAEQAADRRETSRLDQVAGGSTVKNKPEMGFDSEAPSEESANWKPESALRSSFDDCWSSAGGDAAKLACIHKELSYQDFELNKNYKRLKEILGDKDRALLIEEQRQWLGETESACGALGNNLDGDVDPVYCRLYRTAQRSQELQTMIELERE